MLRQQLDQQEKAAAAHASSGQPSEGEYGSLGYEESQPSQSLSTLGTANLDDDDHPHHHEHHEHHDEHDDEGTDHSSTDDEDDEDDEDTNGSSLQESYETDERSGLLSSIGGSFRTNNRRGRDRAGSFVSYTTTAIWSERIRQSIRYGYELFFPPDDEEDGMDGDGWASPDLARSSNREGGITARHKVAVIFNFSLLAVGYSTERSTFKVLVDKAGPFRLFSAEVITGFHAAVLGLGLAGGMMLKWGSSSSSSARGGSGGDGGSGGSGPPDVAVKGLGMPLADVGLMAVLDTAHLLLAVISGSTIPPVLTVILIQFTIPLTVFITEFFHPMGRCRKVGGVLCCIGDPDEEDMQNDEEGGGTDGRSPGATPNRSNVSGGGGGGGAPSSRTSSGGGSSGTSDGGDDDNASISSFGRITGRHQCGALLIFLAIILVLSPTVMVIADPATSRFNIHDTEEEGVDPAIADKRSAWNTLLFALSCVPAAASQLYKEHTLAHFRQPVDPKRLNFLLSFFQFIFAMIVSPLLYPLQGLANGDGWTALYPSKQTSQNFYDGISCLITGTLDEAKAASLYPEPAYCNLAWLVILIHVLAIITVGYAVERIVERGATRMVHRAISAGFVVAIIAMYAYEVIDPSVKYGPISHGYNLCAATIIFFGGEMYHSAATAEATFETTYQAIGDLYEEEE